jgi:phosphoglucomutase
MVRKNEIETEIGELKDDSPGANPMAEGVRRAAAKFDLNEKGSVGEGLTARVLREGEREKLADAGYQVRQIDSDEYADLETVALTDDAEEFLDELRDDLDYDALREELDEHDG